MAVTVIFCCHNDASYTPYKNSGIIPEDDYFLALGDYCEGTTWQNVMRAIFFDAEIRPIEVSRLWRWE